MKKIFFFFLIVSLEIFPQITNYRITPPTVNYAEEVVIAINPLEPQILAAGANINYSFRSTDGGVTWSYQQLSSTYGVWGDPVTLFDKSGNLYFVHLSNPDDGYWIDRIVVQKSTDNGVTFNDGSYTGLISPHNQDKAWIAADLTNSQYKNTLYLTWTEFDSYGSTSSSDSTRILFSKSTDFAESWSEPIKINDVNGDCRDEDNTVEGAVPAVGPNGEIYVAWSGPLGIMFDKSTDGGETWGEDIFVAEQPGGWDYGVEGLYRANGLPVTACDTSSASPYKGTIYVVWSDQRNGDTNPDVFITKSTDGGETWSEAVKVNNDETERPQFFAWLAIDQTNGNLYVTFYDRRNTTGTYTDFYLARSSDGGETWKNYCVTDNSFPTSSDVFFGDYATVAAFNGVIHPIWMETNAQNNLSVWTAVIHDEDLTDIEQTETRLPKQFALRQNYPNPFNPTTTISYSIPNGIVSSEAGRQSAVNVALSVYNALGEKITTLVNKEQAPGEYSVRFDARELPSGVYFYTLRAGEYVRSRKMILMK